MRFLLAVALLVLVRTLAHAQGVEGVFVETYAVTPATKAGEAPLSTYRLYIDLAPGYRLQMVYGDRAHQMKIGSKGYFFNDTVNGAKYADRINTDLFNTWPLALDTWLTIGAVGDHFVGVPKHLDTDGSVLDCPPYPGKGIADEGSAKTGSSLPVCIADGLQPDTAQRQIVDFQFAYGCLDKVPNNLLETTDGAWAALGGRAGATKENMVLIAQISTTAPLYYTLNLQLADPDGFPVKYVAHDPAAGEILFEGLEVKAVR